MSTRRLRHGFLFLASTLVALGACHSGSTDRPQWLAETSGIRGIFEDSRGDLYFTSPDWTCRYDASARDSESGGFTYFTQEWKSVHARFFEEDSSGQLWTRGAKGIQSFDREVFTPVLRRTYDAKHRWAKASGDVWLGVDGDGDVTEREGLWGVYRLHDGEWSFLAFPDPPAGERHRFYPLTAPAMQAKDGKLWFGTFNAAFGFDGESFDIIGRERMGLAGDPRDIGIRGYFLDSQDNLWMADNGAGAFVYDGKEVLHFTAHHDLEDEDTDGPSLHRAFSIAEDADGNLWFGTVYSGIWRYVPSEEDPLRKGTFTHFGEEQGWPCQNAWTIYRRRNGELLFGGEKPGGVYRFDGEAFERVF